MSETTPVTDTSLGARVNPRRLYREIKRLVARIDALEARLAALEPQDGYHAKRGPRGKWFIYHGDASLGEQGYETEALAMARCEELAGIEVDMRPDEAA